MKVIPLTDGITQIVTDNPETTKILKAENISFTTFNNSIFIKTPTAQDKANARVLAFITTKEA